MVGMRQLNVSIGLLGLVLFLTLVLSLAHADAPLGNALAITPTAYNYLPFVANTQPTATPTPSPTPAPSPDDWRGYVNYYRSLAGLPAVTENAVWSDGCRKHAQYMVETDITHDESSTPEGFVCAQNAVLMCTTAYDATAQDAVEAWMQGSFHALPIIDPKLVQVGYGSYRAVGEKNQMCAALDVSWWRGLDPQPATFPIMWPSDGKVLPLIAYNVIELPSPLVSPDCFGYSLPTGVALSVQFGLGELSPNVTAHTLTQGGTPLEHCVLDETTYTSPDASEQLVGRYALDRQDAILIIPRAPLTRGASYVVSITADGQTHTWSFSVSAAAAVQAAGEKPTIWVR
jgi:hypothetical protein